MHASRDLHSNVKVVRAIVPAAVGTTGIGNGKLSGVIDRRGYGGVEFIYGFGTSAAVTDVVNAIVYECATSGGSFTSVADADLIGTEAAASYPAVTGRTSGVSQNFFSKLGYKGNQPFLKTRLYGIGTATCIVSAAAVLHSPRHAPAA